MIAMAGTATSDNLLLADMAAHRRLPRPQRPDMRDLNPNLGSTWDLNRMHNLMPTRRAAAAAKLGEKADLPNLPA